MSQEQTVGVGANHERQLTQFRLRQAVDAADGPFGEIGDIVVDPMTRSVTHLVVEPHNAHHQARLVPMGLVNVHGDRITIGLDTAYLRRLDRVAFTDFIEVGHQLDIGGSWDVGISDCVTLPYVDRAASRELGVEPIRNGIEVKYDRVPKGVCELRRSSDVVSADGHVVGHVDGFLAEGEQIVGLIVRGRWPSLRRQVVVPIDMVDDVRNDLVGLTLTRSEYRHLPHTTGVDHRS